MPLLHSWNDFSLKPKRKISLVRGSPKKKCRITKPESSDEELLPSSDLPNSDTETPSIDYQEIVEKPITDKKQLESQVKLLSKENCMLKSDILVVEHIKSDDDTCNHYTGFKSYDRLLSVFKYLDFGELGENLIMHNNKDKLSDKGRPRSLSPMNSFLLTLMRLRMDFSILHLSFLFNISSTTVSNTFISYINYMYIKLGIINIWPSLEHIKKSMPESMKKKFPNTKCIIDCVEFKVKVASALFHHKMFYSDYKSHTTVKVLVGIIPGGGFNFVSNAYPGSISDKNITLKCGILNPELWNAGEALMADRGFTIEEYTKILGIELIIPAFLRGRDQMTESEVITTQQIANERIHVERMIQRLKCYHIFDRVIPISMIGTLNQIISVCALLANFDDPIIKR